MKFDIIDLLNEEAQRLKQSLMLHAFGVMVDCGADIENGQVYVALIGKRTPQSLKDAVIGETKAAEPGGDTMDNNHGSFTFWVWVSLGKAADANSEAIDIDHGLLGFKFWFWFLYVFLIL